MTAPPVPPPPAFPTYRSRDFLPAFLLGWALGAVLTFLVRAAGQALLPTPCEGHTLLALLMPLLLGPGGLAFTALNWRQARRAALGLGLVVASLLPALFVGAQDIGRLRAGGCAGGYLVFTTPTSATGKSVSSLSIPASTQRELSARIGGYTPQEYPEDFTLSTESSAPGVQIILPRQTVKAGESFPVQVRVAPGTGVNTYLTVVTARTRHQGRDVAAAGTLEISVQHAP